MLTAPTPGIGPWIQSYSGRRVCPLELTPDQVTVVDVAHALSMAPRFAAHTCRPYPVGEHCIYVAECVALDAYFRSRVSMARGAHPELQIGYVSELAARLRCSPMVLHPNPELGRLLVSVIFSTYHKEGAPAAQGLAVRALLGLGHDASETYLVDLPTPVKMRLEDYKIAEKGAEGVCRIALLPVDALDWVTPERMTAVKSADHAVLLAEKSQLLTVPLADWSPGIPRDRHWLSIARAVVGAWPGSLTEWERRAYLRPVVGQCGDVPPDPHAPRAVESAYYRLHVFLHAIIAGETPEQANDHMRETAL